MGSLFNYIFPDAILLRYRYIYCLILGGEGVNVSLWREESESATEGPTSRCLRDHATPEPGIRVTYIASVRYVLPLLDGVRRGNDLHEMYHVSFTRWIYLFFCSIIRICMRPRAFWDGA